MTCTTLCHVGIARRTVPFNDIKFSMKPDVAVTDEVSDCHSPRETTQTFMKNCAECHHGKGIKKVKLMIAMPLSKGSFKEKAASASGETEQ